jgi:hypothetical protein
MWKYTLGLICSVTLAVSLCPSCSETAKSTTEPDSGNTDSVDSETFAAEGSDDGFISLRITEDDMIAGHVSLEISQRDDPGETPIFVSGPFETEILPGY